MNSRARWQSMSPDRDYTVRDQVTSLTRYSNLAGTTLVGTSAMLYDSVGRPTKLQHKNAGGNNIANYQNAFDLASRITSEILNNGPATNKSYAFTQAKPDKDGEKARDVYFEFDAKLAPVKFDRAKIKPFQLDPPLNILREYTQVLIDAKKIDPTPPKKKE